MELTVKVKIPDDTVYRYHFSPYAHTSDLRDDISAAICEAMYQMQDGGNDAVVPVRSYGNTVGKLRVKAR